MRISLPEDRPRVEVSIKDGRKALLSPVDPSDRRYFTAGVEELSIESRYTRFGQGVARLSEWELNYLTDIDQVSHVAFGAAVDGDVAGVGRYIIGDDGCPEIAVTVIDRFQNLGLGSSLFQALVAVARNDGLSRLCFDVLEDNEPVLHLMSRLGVEPLRHDGILSGTVQVSDMPGTDLDDQFVAAIGSVRS